MNRWKLSLRATIHFRRTNAAVAAGIVIATAVCVGSLAVGDSVRNMLRNIADARLGAVRTVVAGGDRFFRETLHDDVGNDLGVVTAPIILLQGSVTAAGKSARVNRVQIVGVTDAFWGLQGSGANTARAPGAGSAIVNDHLSVRLGLAPGDSIVLRIRNPGSIPADAPLSDDRTESVAMRRTVEAVAGKDDFGRFSLRADQLPPDTVFVPLEDLQDAIQRRGQINLLLVGGADADPDQVRPAIRRHWRLIDSELQMTLVESANQYALSSPRVFLDAPIECAALGVSGGALPVLTYFVNEIAHGTNATPYSMVSGVTGNSMPGLGEEHNAPDGSPPIVINQWLSDDLGAETGDKVDLRYYVVGPRRTLLETSATFRVSAVVPLQGAALDPDLMPPFPGLSDADDCSDWDLSFPVDLSRIRDRDETYWDEYHGTPKAFIPYTVGSELWANRFGRTTSIRYPAAAAASNELVRALEHDINPFSLGIEVQDVRAAADAARNGGMDFGSLILSFSSFLVIASLLLSGLLFVFGVESRIEEIGLLRSLGFAPGAIGRMFLREGSVTAALACAAGIPVGIVYTRILLAALSSAWTDAVGGSVVDYHVGTGAMVTGALSGFSLAMIVMFFCAGRLAKRAPVESLAGSTLRAVPAASGRQRSRMAALLALFCAVLAIVTAFKGIGAAGAAQAQSFFGAGMLMLIAGIAATAILLKWRPKTGRTVSLSRRTLIWSGTCRRSGRSLTTVGLLACGCFMIIAVTAHRLDVQDDALSADSGTGGFTHIMELSRPFTRDLSDPAVREDLGAEFGVLDDVIFVPVRVKEGDEASCLNLNRAQQPRLLGIDPTDLPGRFTFAASMNYGTEGSGFADETADPWVWLTRNTPKNWVPAVADNNSILWAMGKKVGDSLSYRDERGRPFEVKLTGGLANSMMQGSVLIPERAFVRKYPSASGYEMYFVDAGGADETAFAEEIEFALADYGVELIPAGKRLAEFNAVQNSYLSMFQILGAFGVLIGIVGLGVVVLRNVLERRSELGLMRALGWSRSALIRSVVSEHACLLLLGCTVGIVAAAVGVIPSLTSPATGFPFLFVLITMAGIFLNGLLWTVIATRLSVSGSFLDALKEE